MIEYIAASGYVTPLDLCITVPLFVAIVAFWVYVLRDDTEETSDD